MLVPRCSWERCGLVGRRRGTRHVPGPAGQLQNPRSRAPRGTGCDASATGVPSVAAEQRRPGSDGRVACAHTSLERRASHATSNHAGCNWPEGWSTPPESCCDPTRHEPILLPRARSPSRPRVTLVQTCAARRAAGLGEIVSGAPARRHRFPRTDVANRHGPSPLRAGGRPSLVARVHSCGYVCGQPPVVHRGPCRIATAN